MCLWVVNEPDMEIEERNKRLQQMCLFMMSWVNFPIFKKGVVLRVQSENKECAGIATLVPPGVNVQTFFQNMKNLMTIGLPPCEKHKQTWGTNTNIRLESMECLHAIREKHSKKHGGIWYLQTLGTHPRYRGQGHGGRLLRAICRLGDFDKTCVYLETESRSNERLYRKFGFETVEEVTLCENQKEAGSYGIEPFVMFCMLRKPQHTDA